MVISTAQPRQKRPRFERIKHVPPKWRDINLPKHRILELLGWAEFATIWHMVNYCGYSSKGKKGSYSYVQDCFAKELYHTKYIDKITVANEWGRGSSPDIFILDKLGRAYLKELGLLPEGREKPSRYRERGPLWLAHTLSVIDWLILVKRFAQAAPTVELVELFTERDCQRKNTSVVPDAWVKLAVGDHAACFALELDRSGTERFEKVRKKLEGYVSFGKPGGEYQTVYKADDITVLFLTLQDEKRLQQLVAWAKQVLHPNLYKHFLFAEFDPAIDPSHLFYLPVWQRADGHRVPLLGG